jgi:hypothetical protein
VHARSAIVPAVLALALGGCSLTQAKTTTPKASGGAKAIGTVISNLSSDASGNNPSTICSQILASSLVAHLNSIGSCKTIIGNQLNTAQEFTLTPTKYGVNGNTATAIVKAIANGKNTLYTVTFVKQAGTWKISGLSPAS